MQKKQNQHYQRNTTPSTLDKTKIRANSRSTRARRQQVCKVIPYIKCQQLIRGQECSKQAKYINYTSNQLIIYTFLLKDYWLIIHTQGSGCLIRWRSRNTIKGRSSTSTREVVFIRRNQHIWEGATSWDRDWNRIWKPSK